MKFLSGESTSSQVNLGKLLLDLQKPVEAVRYWNSPYAPALMMLIY